MSRTACRAWSREERGAKRPGVGWRVRALHADRAFTAACAAHPDLPWAPLQGVGRAGEGAPEVSVDDWEDPLGAAGGEQW